MFGDKLRTLLERNGISPAELADTIGVNRSAISHVLNNRNKPGYDFLNKMHKAFPDWDYDWLIFDEPKQQIQKHKPITNENKPTNQASKFTQGSLFDTNNDTEGSNSITPSRMKRTVTKTILIYSDGTFEIFQNNFK